MAAHKKTRPTIALFIHKTFGMHYQFSILSGVFDAARRYNVDLISVCGPEYFMPDNPSLNANLIYQWVGKGNVDGIIIVSSIFNYMDEEFQRGYCEALKPVPLRALGRIAGDLPNVITDNTSGLRELIRHLIEKHSYRRLAFVNGPIYNKDSKERYAVYREVLAEYNMPFDPDLLVPGEFRYEDGQEAVRLLWDERKVKVDAIVCGNDDTAFGVLDGLRGREIKVPEQIAVTGFDDSNGAATTIPPLTTVRQPIYQEAYESVELLLAQIQGESVPDSLVFLTQPVYRRSCGCPSFTVQKTITLGNASAANAAGSLRELLSKKRQEILLALRRMTAALFEPIAEHSDMFIQALIADLEPEEATEPGGTFLLLLEDKLWETPVPNDHSMDWHSMVSSMREQMLPFLRSYPVALLKAETLWQTAQVLISERLHQKPSINPVRQEMENNSFRWITQALITTFEQDTLMDVLAKSLPELGIFECYVGLYEDIGNSAGPARLTLSYQAGKRIELERGGRQFPSPQALVGSLLAPEKQHTFVMESLYFLNECYGFVVFELGDSIEQVTLNMGLRESISGGLKGARLAREVQQHSAKLENAYQSLRENQQQLMLAEKMASLGRLTAGIAHEMNTPLAAVRAAMIQLDSLIQEYEASIGDPSVVDADHHEIAKELRATLQLADKAAERAAGFVRGVKSQTRGLTSQERQAINAVVAVEDALLLLNHVLRQGKCLLDFQTSGGDIRLFGAPGRLEQVVTNLINNAVEASYPDGGPITVRLDARKSDFVELQVSDSGCGILPENLSKIFDPMFSTKPFGSSTGLGLTIVHDIVVGEFGGSIDVNSVEGEGTTFTLRFPVRE